MEDSGTVAQGLSEVPVGPAAPETAMAWTESIAKKAIDILSPYKIREVIVANFIDWRKVLKVIITGVGAIWAIGPDINRPQTVYFEELHGDKMIVSPMTLRKATNDLLNWITVNTELLLLQPKYWTKYMTVFCLPPMKATSNWKKNPNGWFLAKKIRPLKISSMLIELCAEKLFKRVILKLMNKLKRFPPY